MLDQRIARLRTGYEEKAGQMLALLLLWLPGCAKKTDGPAGWLLFKLPKPMKVDPITTPGAGGRQDSPEVNIEGKPDSGTGVLDLSNLPTKSIPELIEENVDKEKLPSNPTKATALSKFLPESACGLPRAIDWAAIEALKATAEP